MLKNSANHANQFNRTSSAELAAEIWQQVDHVAAIAGLDAGKFGADHKEIVERIAAFLANQPAENPENNHIEPVSGGWLAKLGWGKQTKTEPETSSAVPPIIVCGVPGTGKTTFLYVLDRVLRTTFGLPDLIQPEMMEADGRTFQVPKRMFCGGPVSLLSVRKWSELLHFYAWDIDEHRFNRHDLDTFIAETLGPMQIIFADEVEMSGYSPTLPDLAAHGLLVVGTSNQYDFKQLDREKIAPKIYRFEGADMRSGDPVDAVVQPNEPLWEIFNQLTGQPLQTAEQLGYRTLSKDGRVTVLLDFRQAVQAPMHETQWYGFLNKTWDETAEQAGAIQPDSKYALLLEAFTLDDLRTDYNAIIRFVWLFDAIEQLGIGVLVRNINGPAGSSAELSREAFSHMKVTIHTARGVSDEIKARALVGIDRAISRIGQAGVRARAIYQGWP
ncbi:MAG: hypothetical protein ACI85U_002475 [Candidatus Promineifilaceae bacterium]|jgi:hypothetical protein